MQWYAQLGIDMGFNSVLFVCNDAIGTIRHEPEEFSNLIAGKMGSADFGEGEFGFGNHCNGFDFPHIGHADEMALIAVGGNYATRILRYRAGNEHMHHTKEGQVEILKRLAKELGYSVRKKPE